MRGENGDMRKIIAIAFILTAALCIFAQNGSPLRFEIPAPNGSDPFNYVTAGNKGVCIFFPTVNESDKDSISWSFLMIDRNLKEQWHKLVPLHKDVTYLKCISTPQALYLLFHDTKENKEGNIFVFMIMPQLQLITEFHGTIPARAEVVDFDISDNRAFIGFNNRKGQPGIISFSLVTGEHRSYEITSEKDALLLDISIDTLRHDVFATYKIQYSSSRNHLYVNQYNSPGALVKTFDFTEQIEKKNFNSAQYVPMGDGTGLVTGTYGYNVSNTRRQYDYYDYYYNSYYYNYYSPYFLRQPDYNENQDNTPVSDGYFSAKVNKGIAEKVKYYNFSNFDNAYKYMTDVNALRAKNRTDKKEEKLSDKGLHDENNDKTLNLRLLIHDVTLNHGQLVLVSEAYSPEYLTSTQMSYDYYGRAFPTTYETFNGFRYSHAFVAGFDSSGNMTWNNGMEMRDILTKYLNRKLNCIFEGEETVLFYNANNKVAFKKIDGNTIVDNTAYTTLPSRLGTDQFLDEYLGTMEYWYDDYFIATGYESIRNNFMENNKRNVFYITKLAFK